MNNEIEKILDKINNVVNHKEASYNALVETKAEDYKQLLDYITNLQQENKRLKEYYDLMVQFNQKNLNRYCVYKSRCEKAIGYMKYEMIDEPIQMYKISQIDVKKLLDILQGSDKE